jgi:hypothetical protein
MTHVLNALWVLNREDTAEQKPLLRAMGRPFWQQYFIDDTEETFHLSVTPGPTITKDVTIVLCNSVFTAMRRMTFGVIPFDTVHYKHHFLADGSVQKHTPDRKGFGKCHSITTVTSNGGILMKWFLSNGILRVHHEVLQKQLHVKLEFTDKHERTTAGLKIYDRSQSGNAYLKYDMLS